MKSLRFSQGWLQRVLVCVVTLWLMLFLLMPNALVVLTSLLSRQSPSLVGPPWTLANYRQVLGRPFLQIFFHSFMLSGWTALTCLLIGYPFAFFLAQMKKKRLRAVLVFLAIVPFWTNSLVRLYGIRSLLSVQGGLNTLLLWMGLSQPIHFLGTQFAVIVGLVYMLFPFMVLPLYTSMEKLDPAQLEAAQDLGASSTQTFLHIVFPLTLPGVIAGTIMVFLPAMSLFYVVDLLGGAQQVLVGNLIKTQCLMIQDWPLGAATSVALTGVMGLLIYGQACLERRLQKL